MGDETCKFYLEVTDTYVYILVTNSMRIIEQLMKECSNFDHSTQDKVSK